jgi:hypothetical protein
VRGGRKRGDGDGGRGRGEEGGGKAPREAGSKRSRIKWGEEEDGCLLLDGSEDGKVYRSEGVERGVGGEEDVGGLVPEPGILGLWSGEWGGRRAGARA